MSLAFFVGWLQRSPAFLHLLHYLKQLPRLGFPSVVTLSAEDDQDAFNTAGWSAWVIDDFLQSMDTIGNKLKGDA